MAINFFNNLFGGPSAPPPLPTVPAAQQPQVPMFLPTDTFVPTTPRERAAAKNYDQYGDTNYNLNNRDQVKQLLAHSPQLDNDSAISNDGKRCGGAALVALSLLDGRPQANANALRKTAEQYGVPLNDAQQSALQSMSEGHLNPTETARLQELAWKTAGMSDNQPNAVGNGVRGQEIGATLSTLRANDGLTNLKTATVNVQVQNEGKHATATAVDQNGEVVSYNPWPKNDGQAPVVDQNTVPKNDPFLSEQYTVVNPKNGKPALVVEKGVDENGNYRPGGSTDVDNVALEKTRQPIVGDGVSYDEIANGSKVYLDPKTGKPLPAAQSREIEDKVANPKAAEAADTGAETEPKRKLVQVAPTQVDVIGNIAAVEARAEKSLVNKQVSYQSKNVQAQAGVKVCEVAAYAGASANVDLKNLKINAEVHAGVEANLVDAQASARVKLGNIGDLGGEGRARVGADAVGQAGVGFDPKHGDINVGASGEAFTGARANAGVNLNLGPVGGHAGVAVQAGVGIQAAVDVGMKNGKFSFNLDFGFSLGIGIRFNLGFSIDFKAIGKGIVDGVKAIGKGFKKAGKAIAKGAKKMKRAAKKAVKWAGKTAKKAAKKLKKVGKKVGKKLKKLFGRKRKHKAKHKPEVTHKHHHMVALKKSLDSKHSSMEHVA